MKHLNRLEKILWPALLIWAAVGLVTSLLKFNEGTLSEMQLPVFLNSFLALCLRWGDFIFHLLAAGNLLFAVSQAISWRKTWISFLVITVLSGVVETLGTRTGFPFGDYIYTDRMGPMLMNTLPLAIPLAWWNILSPFFMLMRHYFPKLNPRLTCLSVAALATLIDWIMEPFAWRIKGYWIWTSGTIPLQNYCAWFALSFLLCRVSPIYSPYRPILDKRFIAVPALMLAFFIGVRLIYGV